ncbi:MAG: S41 family peptidase [Nitrospirota bacterium]
MLFWKKKISWLIVGILFLGLSVGDSRSSADDKRQEMYDGLRLFSQVLSLVQTQYVDIEKVESKELVYGAINGLLKSLNDPHTRFMPPESYKEMKVETEGEFGGLGIVIGIKDEQLTVISPIEETPAALAGVKAGDRIMEINGTTTKEISLFDAVSKLRGPKGTQITISIAREGEKEWLKFTITRDIIKIKSVKYDVIKEDIGYVRISSFNQKTQDELHEALLKLKEANIKNLILDLRNNPGGLLDSAVAVTDEFLPPNVLIVSINGRIPQMNQDYKTTKQGVDYPMVVLINQGSASGSEIVAGAIQDHQYEKFLITDKEEYEKWENKIKEGNKEEISIIESEPGKWYVKRKVGPARGVIVGMQSFGKGSVQTVLPLADNSGVALTTAKYYTPSGRTIHGKGITPDIIVEEPKLTKEDEEMLKKLEEGGYVKKFIEEHNPYKKEDLKNLQADLAKNKIELKEVLLQKKIDIEIMKKESKKEPIYDLVLDTQLQRAVDILVASQIFNRN